MANASVHRALKAALKRFQTEVLLTQDPLAPTFAGVTIDRKADAHRIIVLVHGEASDQVKERVGSYFGTLHHKVVCLHSLPSHTSGIIRTGDAISWNHSDAGTLGAVYAHPQAPEILLGLSNSHVLSAAGALPLGSPIFGPGGQQVGTLAGFQPIQGGNALNFMDLAILRFDPGIQPAWFPVQPTGAIPARIQLAAYKRTARDPEWVQGTVRSTGATVLVQILGQNYWFGDVICVEGVGGLFADRGDSGAMIYSKGFQAIGIQFARMDTYAYIIPIRYAQSLGYFPG
jgi:hypothetical protein